AVGFEPTVASLPRRFSRPFPSAARARLPGAARGAARERQLNGWGAARRPRVRQGVREEEGAAALVPPCTKAAARRGAGGLRFRVADPLAEDDLGGVLLAAALVGDLDGLARLVRPDLADQGGAAVDQPPVELGDHVARPQPCL